jgi:hypothetical protein
MIFDVKVDVDGRVVENGWTQQASSLNALELAVRRTTDHVHMLGLRAPAKISIEVEVRGEGVDR